MSNYIQFEMDAVNELPDPPTDVEIRFGLKAPGEAGNVAIGKLAGEVNCSIKLAWKKFPSGGIP